MSILRRFASGIDDWLDKRRSDALARKGQDDPIVPIAYRGHGTVDGRIWLRGSVVEQDTLEKPAIRGGLIEDLSITLQRSVIRTGIAAPLQNIRTVVESDPEARVAFPGLAALYRALQQGDGQSAEKPIFYVSSGSWKLYDLITRFKALNGIPRGPVFMDDWGLDETRWFKSSHGAHKTATIDRIMETYPDLDFILVGDSGQHDAEIYAKALQDHGNRIRGIWIRDVSDDARDAQVLRVLEAGRAAGASIHAETDLLQAATDAATRGWITQDALDTVRGEIEAATA